MEWPSIPADVVLFEYVAFCSGSLFQDVKSLWKRLTFIPLVDPKEFVKGGE